MMTTLLMVLKIIGLVLLGILALAIFLLLIALFVPVRYKVSGDYDIKYECNLKVTYLLHLITFVLYYKSMEGTPAYILRVAGIKIPLAKNRKSDNTADSNTVVSDDNKESEAESENNEKAKPRKSVKDIISSAKSVVELLNDEQTKAAWVVCKKRIGRLFKHILPRKTDIRVVYGLNDPAVTGYIMAVYNVLYLYFGKSITLIPVYDEQKICAKVYLKGHMRPAPIIWQLFMVLLDRNCRDFYKRIKSGL